MPTGRWRWSLSTGGSPQRRGLGRGFEVLIGGPAGQELAQVPVDAIHPNPKQPRRRFEHDATAGLADSIRSQGLLQPVLLRPRAAGGEQLIAGEPRRRPAEEGGLAPLPAGGTAALDHDTLLPRLRAELP